jgi:CheY-like chemotaxis protein
VSAVSRVLLVDPDRATLAALQAALGAAGFRDVSAVTSASFALTMLERNRPDLIVSRVGVPDIDGYELCSIVRNDPSMAGVLFLLLASPGDEAPDAMLEEKPDQTLAGDLPLSAIVAEVAGLLGTRRVTAQPSAPSEPTAARPPAAASPPAAAAPPAVTAPRTAAPPVEVTPGMKGSLGVMNLPDIAQAVALGGKTGELLITLPSGRGVIVFDHGRVVHAEFFGLIGETAFETLLAAAHGAAPGETYGSFVFHQLENDAAGGTKTIHCDLKQLLLNATAELDEGRAGAATAPLS